MESDIHILKEQVKSDDWETSLSAADRLGDIGTEEAIQPLLDNLKSDDNFRRNAAALGLMRTKNQKYFNTLINRIKELGVREEIGTLVYALENFDCSLNLYDIVDLYLNGNAEVQMGTTTILNEQKFTLTKEEIKRVSDLLDRFNYSLEGFKISYQIID
jgi:HEAT repeat protein